MNKGITAEQVAKVMDLEEWGIEVTERVNDAGYGHTYTLTFEIDVDFSMHEVVALAALFGAKGVSAQFTPTTKYHAAGFSIVVAES